MTLLTAASFVYMFQANNGAVKIGATQRPEDYLRNLRADIEAGSGQAHCSVFCCGQFESHAEARVCAKARQRAFQKHCVAGEWFNLAASEMRLCGDQIARAQGFQTWIDPETLEANWPALPQSRFRRSPEKGDELRPRLLTLLGGDEANYEIAIRTEWDSKQQCWETLAYGPKENQGALWRESSLNWKDAKWLHLVVVEALTEGCPVESLSDAAEGRVIMDENPELYRGDLPAVTTVSSKQMRALSRTLLDRVASYDGPCLRHLPKARRSDAAFRLSF